jgi:hypothetical protein
MMKTEKKVHKSIDKNFYKILLHIIIMILYIL